MSENNNEKTSSDDDEIFFGPITLAEVKRRLKVDKPYAASAVNSPRACEDPNANLKILQTHSEPNLLAHKDTSDQIFTNMAGWDMTEDDSFMKLENMVANLCEKEKFNNTLEVVDYILNHPPSDTKKSNLKSDNKVKHVEPAVGADDKIVDEPCLKKLQELSPQENMEVDQNIHKRVPKPPQNTPVTLEKNIAKDIEGFTTPVNVKSVPVLKTPAQHLSVKKPTSSVKKIANVKSNAYEHIKSPVASYIKNCNKSPLVKEVQPKKTLVAGPSSIPKFKSGPAINTNNKENMIYPAAAYINAVTTKLIDLPDEQKLPQSEWAKKIMTALPRPLLVEHSEKENNSAKKAQLLQQEDSFADLSYQQAEVSIHIKKTPLKKN